MPTIDSPYMVLTITAPSLSASDLEDSVVDDIEKLILTFGDVTSVSSTIYDNYAVIISVYSFSTDDPDKLSIDIFTKINDLSLNENVSDISYSSNFDDPHIIYAVHSDSLSEIELLSISRDYKNGLLLLDEVNYIDIDSVIRNEVIIKLDSTMMNLYDLDIYEIYQILYANSINIPLGGISTSYGIISISGNVEISDVESLQNIIIIPEIPTIIDTVYLKDIASVSLENTSEKIYKFNDENAVFLSLHFEDDIDFTKMGDEVTALKDKFLDDNRSLDISIDEMLYLPDYVDSQINNVFYSLLIAILVVMVIVFIGIGFRNSLLIILTIPLIIFATIAILYLFGFELHKLTIVGLIIAIGILVDNSIVITEGIKLNIDKGLDKISSAKKAINDNSIPVLSSTLTTIAAFIVLVLLPGFLGEIISSMPLTVIIAITLSYVVSMVLSPVLATIFLKETSSNKEIKVSIHEKNIKSMIRFTIKFPLLWIFISVALLGLSVYFAFDKLPIDLYPNDERAVLYIDIENEILGDLESTEELNSNVIDLFKDNQHVENYSTSIGGNLPSFHFSSYQLNERKQNSRVYINFDYNEKELLEYKKELEFLVDSIPNAKITVSNLELSPPLAPLIVTLKSDNLDLLELSSANIFSEIIELDSVKSYNIISNVESIKYNIIYDFEKISNAYLSKAQIDQIIAMNVNGLDLNEFTFNNEKINIKIVSDIESIYDILDLKIYSDILTTSFYLNEFIEIEISEGFAVINKIDNIETSYIQLYVADDSNLQDLRNDVTDITDKNTNGNLEIEFGGENEMFNEISGDLIRASIIAIILIYIVMFVQFNNCVKPLIVYLTIPLSFTGSFAFLLLFNSPITATSLIGMVSLIGVTVNTGILLVEYISRNHENGNDIIQACVDAVYTRFRPIILTSLTTILGLIPLLLTGGNFFKPLAITFMGGMISSTILTIFLVPSVYYLIYKNRTKKKTSE
jgi:multidrug efflux pump subunit AcrB